MDYNDDDTCKLKQLGTSTEYKPTDPPLYNTSTNVLQ